MPRDDEPFHDELIDEIVGAIGCTDAKKRTHLTRQLHGMPGFAGLMRTHQSPVSPSDMDKRLASIESAASKLPSSLGIPGSCTDRQVAEAHIRSDPELGVFSYQVGKLINPHNPEKVIQSGLADKTILDTAWAVARLRDAAITSRRLIFPKIKSGRGGARREEDWALEEVVWNLLRLYREVTGRKPGTSVSAINGEVGGPAVRFLMLCLPPLGLTRKTEQAARDMIRAAMSESDHP